MTTLEDVARLAGVGRGTVSRVVTGKGAVAPATFERVQRAIVQLGFQPSHAARSLMSGSLQMIGVYIPILKGAFYAPLLQSIDTELRAAGLHMAVVFGKGLGGARRQAMEGIEFLMQRGCDGLLVFSSALEAADIATLGANQARVVLLNHRLDAIDAQCFCPDHAEGGRVAARALLAHGHRQFAVLGGPSAAPDNIARIDGFLGELGAAGIDTAPIWIGESDFSPEGGWALAQALLARNDPATGLFCANDEMAVGALSYLQQASIVVPRDVSLVAYDDTAVAEFSAPRLTSVHVPWRDITLAALSELINRCYGARRPVARHFAVTLASRASLAAPPAQPQLLQFKNSQIPY